jgi:hypothetical protein
MNVIIDTSIKQHSKATIVLCEWTVTQRNDLIDRPSSVRKSAKTRNEPLCKRPGETNAYFKSY